MIFFFYNINTIHTLNLILQYSTLRSEARQPREGRSRVQVITETPTQSGGETQQLQLFGGGREWGVHFWNRSPHGGPAN